MDKELTLSLQCIRNNGLRESTELTDHTLSEARELARQVLCVGKDLYTEVNICNADRTIETIQNAPEPMNLSQVVLIDDDAGDTILFF
jgi:hypothetical protein